MSNTKKYHKKTILQVVPALVSGGVERGTVEISNALVKDGYRSIVISSGGPMVDGLIQSGGEHIKMNVASKNPIKIWLNAKAIEKIIKEYNVDIIHARSRAPAWSCGLAAKSTGIKFITTFHGIYNFSNPIKKYYNSIMTKGDLVIAVSNFVKDHIVMNYKIDPSKIVVIHRGVNHKEFDNSIISEAELTQFRNKYKVPKNTPVILLPARFTTWKGQMYLLESLNKIMHKGFYCIMAGDLSKHPDFVDRLKSYIHKNKMHSKVQIFGNEPKMLNLYGISDIVLSTSIEPEAFGRTIIEAQSMKKLVIATNIGGATETIVDGETGFHVSAYDKEELAQRIANCIDLVGTESAEKITNTARDSVVRKFSLNFMLSTVLEIYSQSIKK